MYKLTTLSTKDKHRDRSVNANTKTHTNTHTHRSSYLPMLQQHPSNFPAVITISVQLQSPERLLFPLAHATTHRFRSCTHRAECFQPITADKCPVILYERLWSGRVLDCTALLLPWKPPELFSRPTLSERYFSSKRRAPDQCLALCLWAQCGLNLTKHCNCIRVTLIHKLGSPQGKSAKYVQVPNLFILQTSCRCMCLLHWHFRNK